MKYKILFLATFITFYFQLNGQNERYLPFPCHYDWVNAPSISAVSLPAPSTSLKQKYPGSMNATIDFSDLDIKSSIVTPTCAAALIPLVQSPTAQYSIELSIVQLGNYASFSNNPLAPIVTSKMINLNSTNINEMLPEPRVNGGFLNKYQLSFSVFFLQDWALPLNRVNNVTIKYKIQDLTNLPLGDIGVIRDNTYEGEWKFSYDETPNPITMINLVPPNNADNTWNDNYNINGVIDYYYGCGPDIGGDKIPDYTGKVINEKLSGPFAAGVFTVADLEPAYIAAHPDLVTEEQIVKNLFRTAIGVNFSWFINTGLFHHDMLNLPDSHGKIPITSFNNATAAFSLPALKGGRCMFKINQEYSCNNVIIGTAEIFKGLLQTGATIGDKLLKLHNF